MQIRAARLLVGLVLVAGGCAAANGPESHPQNPKIQRDISEILKRVRMETGTPLFEDLGRLVAYDVFAVEQVGPLSKDPNPRLRSNALWVLAQIQDRNQPRINQRIDKLLREGLDDKERSVRLEAAAGLALRDQWDVLPILIDGLGDEDSGVRYRCHQTLLAATSRNFGYEVNATSDDRQAAIERWRTWFADWKRASS